MLISSNKWEADDSSRWTDDIKTRPREKISGKSKRAKLLFVLIAASLLWPQSTAAQVKQVRRVLIFYDVGLSSPAVELLDQQIRIALESSPFQIELYREYLETTLFPDPVTQQEIRTGYIRKYRDRKPDLIIAIGESPLNFMVEVHEKAFPEVPIVFAGSDEIAGHPKLDHHFTGVWERYEPGKTLEAAVRLLPSTRHVVIVGGTSDFDRGLLALFRKKLSGYEDRFDFTYLTDFDMPTLLQRLKHLPENTVILYTHVGQDAAGTRYVGASQSGPMIARAANAPIFGPSDVELGHGQVGGYLESFAAEGKLVGETVLRILNGTRPQDIPIVEGANVYMFDWRALRRWGVKESALPPGSILLNYQPTIWESYKQYIVGGIFLCLLEASLILGLLWQRARKKRFEQSLVHRMAFEKMLSKFSTTFINLPMEEVDAKIEKSLEAIADYLQLDEITLVEYSHSRRGMALSSSWGSERVPAVSATGKADKFFGWTNLYLRGEIVLASDLEALPEKASAEREHLRKLGAISIATVPLKAGDEFFGGISFISRKRRVLWTVQLVEQLKLLSEIFSNALMRRNAQSARFRHAAIVESSDDAIISKDLNGIILSWNTGARHIFGYSEAEAVGQPITILIPEELHDEEKDIMRRLRAGERVEHYETARVRKDGSRLDVSLTISPINDSAGKAVAFSKIARDITDRKRAEQVLRESEERFRLVANSAPVLIWMSGPDKLCNYFNQPWFDFTGRSIETELGNGWAEMVHPEDCQHCLDTYQEAFDRRDPFERQYRLRRHDGEYRWLLDIGVPRFNPDGSFAGYIGSCIDVTDRKLAEEAMADMGRRLIEAHEEERTWIARELHDDINQRLALAVIELENWNQVLSKAGVDTHGHIGHLKQRLSELGSDIQALSHRLHSSKLDYLGLTVAASSFCRELSEKHKLEIDFTHEGMPGTVPREISLCLFRVLQEALQNAVKYSGVLHFRVKLEGTPAEIRLTVSDHGVGFDQRNVLSGRGLGLISMRERVQLVKGELSVTSQPASGTTVYARVPLKTDEYRAMAG